MPEAEIKYIKMIRLFVGHCRDCQERLRDLPLENDQLADLYRQLVDHAFATKIEQARREKLEPPSPEHTKLFI